MKTETIIPSHILKASLVTMIFSLVSIIGVGWFYSYPDIVEAEVILTSTPPPIDVISNASGYIDSIYVKENEYIKEDQPLALIKSNISYNEIFEIEAFVDQCLRLANPNDLLKVDIPIFTNLGELGEEYLSLYNSFVLLRADLKNTNIPYQIKSLETEKSFIEENSSIIKEEAKIYHKETELMTSEFSRKKGLYDSGSISLDQFEIEKIELLQQEQKSNTVNLKLSNNNILINNLDAKSKQLKNDREQLLSSRWIELQKSMISYKMKINEWKEKYIIKSPYKGMVSYTLLNNEDLYVNKNDVVFVVIPNDTISKIHADCYVPIRNFGKIDVDSKVSIRLLSYPYEEFGSIESYITNISVIPIERKAGAEPYYLAKVHLPNPIVTNYQDTIPFKNELRGIGRIITEERNIFDRFFEKIFSELKNQ